MNKMKANKGQEEMVGFALIIIIVAIILLVFLGISLRSPQKESVKSYEAESFIQSSLQYTTDCRDNFGYLSIKKLIFNCYNGKNCIDDRESCDVLESILTEIIDESWKIGDESPIKGYEITIMGETEQILALKKGNITRDFKGSSQEFVKAGDTFEIFFTVYY